MREKSKEIKVFYKPKTEKSLFLIAFHLIGKGYPDSALKFYQRLIYFGDSLGVMPEKYPSRSYAKYINFILSIFNSPACRNKF